MRIVGGRDYYDSASAYGIDPGITFVRNSRKLTNRDMVELGNWSGAQVSLSLDIEEPEHKPRGWRRPSASHGGSYYGAYQSNVINGLVYGFKDHAVLFCGKVYRGCTISTVDERTQVQREEFHFWSVDRLRKWAEERGLKVGAAGGWWRVDQPLDSMFAPTALDESSIQFMIKHNAAIIWKKESEERPPSPYNYSSYQDADSGWRINADGLKDIGFQSAVDPVTAFQELSMFVGGTLSAQNGPNIVEITDDKVKLAKHGMDKTSFRRPKQAK